jgi:hypothetical protein
MSKKKKGKKKRRPKKAEPTRWSLDDISPVTRIIPNKKKPKRDKTINIEDW